MFKFLTKQFLYGRLYLWTKEKIGGILFLFIAIFLVIYFHNEYLNYVKNNTVENLIKIGIFEKKDLEVVKVKFLKYANVIFDKNYSKNRNLILDYFKKYNVDFVGRFGRWAYLLSDDCFLSGKLIAEKICKNPN